MTTPINELPQEIWTLAFGCLAGNADRVLAVMLVAFEERSERDAADTTGIPKTTIRRDREKFRGVLERFEIARKTRKSMYQAMAMPSRN